MYQDKNDKYLTHFFSKLGEPTTFTPATTKAIDKYRDKLPNQLLEYWNILGFSGFSNGLFWLTNPAEYEQILDRFLEDTPFEDVDIFHVIARNAWGELQVYGEKTGRSIEISPHLNSIRTKKGNENDILAGNEKEVIEMFFAFQKPRFLDTKDEQGKPMFKNALSAHGALNSDEVYGFTPLLFAGGEKKVSNIQKSNIFAHLNLIADMGDMEIIDMASMVDSALNH